MPKQKKNKKNKRRPVERVDDITRAEREMLMLCDRLCAEKDLEPPSMAWLLDDIEPDGRKHYDAWERDIRADFGDVYAVVANILTAKTSHNFFFAGQNMNVEALYILACEYAVDEMYCNFEEYENELVEAELDPKPKTIRIYSSHRSVCEYDPFSIVSTSFWYPSYIPASVQNYFFHLKEADGLSVTPRSLHTILGRVLCRDQEKRKEFAAHMLMVYMVSATRICELTRKITSNQINQILPNEEDETIPSHIRELAETIRKNEKNNVPAAIGRFVQSDAVDFFHNFADVSTMVAENQELYLLAAASENFGLPKLSLFHYILIRLMDGIIANNQEILCGHHNYDVEKCGDKETAEDKKAVLDAYSGKQCGLRKGGYPEHIMGRIMFSSIILQEKVRQSAAARYAQTVESKNTIKAAQKSLEKDRESLAEKEKRMNQLDIERQRETDALTEQVAALKSALAERDEYIKELESQLKLLDTFTEPDIPDMEEIKTLTYPVRIKRGCKIMIYGGHPTWASPMSQRFPDITFRTGRDVFKTDGIKNQDLVLFQNNAISHSASIPAMSEVKKYGIPTANFEKAGVDSCSRQLYKLLCQRDVLDQRT